MLFDALLANVVLVVHFGYVMFTVGGELVILLGACFRWEWVRNLTFRLAHLAAVVFVAIEAIVGVSCPLTVWEYRLRLIAGERVGTQIPFIPRLIHTIIFYNFPTWVFLVAYIGFAVLVGSTFLFIAPRRRKTS